MTWHLSLLSTALLCSVPAQAAQARWDTFNSTLSASEFANVASFTPNTASTAGGVIFIGASMGSRVRALDAATGQEVWSDIDAAPSVSIPAVFTHEDVDDVVVTAEDSSILKPQVADQVVAYRLGSP